MGMPPATSWRATSRPPSSPLSNGAEEPLRVGFDPVRREGALVGLVPGPHVGLDEVGAEADLRVAVPDQVVDGRDDAGGVVRRRRRRAESVNHVAGEGDGLAGGLESFEIVALRRRRDRDDTVDVLPRGRRDEIGRAHDLVAAEPGLERLDENNTAPDSCDLTGDPGEDLAVVGPAGHRREHSDCDPPRHRDTSDWISARTSNSSHLLGSLYRRLNADLDNHVTIVHRRFDVPTTGHAARTIVIQRGFDGSTWRERGNPPRWAQRRRCHAADRRI